MSTPAFAPDDQPMLTADPDTHNRLVLVADVTSPIGRDAVAAFLAACEADADANGGLVSVNRVSAALDAEGIEHHRYSAFWSRFTGKGRPMRRAKPEECPWSPTRGFEPRKGSKSGNDGRLMPIRKWQGVQG